MENLHKIISAEIRQDSSTRQKLFPKIENFLDGRALITFFTSFNHPVNITDDDCDMLQSVLQTTDLKKGLVLMVSSPGGDGLSAERIVNTCRAYSGTKDYWALVPGKAKSAGTIICMGASKILISPASELGPVDPQIILVENNRRRSFSAHSLVSGFDNLFRDATGATGRLEPYIQQLTYYDVREINQYRALIALSESIAVKALKSGMMKGKSEAQIKAAIQVFLNPIAGTLSHGRPIYAGEAKASGLVIDDLSVDTDRWRAIYELYVRSDLLVSLNACKCVESKKEAFHVQAP